MVVQSGLCRTWWETPKTGFLTTRIISNNVVSSSDFCTNYYAYEFYPNIARNCPFISKIYFVSIQFQCDNCSFDAKPYTQNLLLDSIFTWVHFAVKCANSQHKYDQLKQHQHVFPLFLLLLLRTNYKLKQEMSEMRASEMTKSLESGQSICIRCLIFVWFKIARYGPRPSRRNQPT